MYILLYVWGRFEVLLAVVVVYKSKKSCVVLARQVNKPQLPGIITYQGVEFWDSYWSWNWEVQINSA